MGETAPLPGVSVATVLGDLADSRALDLDVLAGTAGLERRITIPHTQKTGLAVAGYDAYLRGGRVLVFGESEVRYLESLSPDERSATMARVFGRDLPCLLLTGGVAAPPEIAAEADRAGVPLLSTRAATAEVMARMSLVLDSYLAARGVVHGVLMDILGLGVLIVGESGIGKSECALDLVVRGHRLVADDAVDLRCRAQSFIIGTCPELTRHHMEIRGLGLINVQDMFGVASTRSSKRVELVVQLERWEHGREYRSARRGRQLLRDARHPGADDPHAGGAGPQRRDPGGGRRAQPAAAHPGPPRGTPPGRPPAPAARGRRTASGTRPGPGRGPLMREQRHTARRAARTAVTSRFVVLTGLSGSGKSQAIRALEDLGYFCVDNLPVGLLPMLAELTLRAGSEISRAAVVVDVREGKMLKEFPGVYRKLVKRQGLNPVLIFLEAKEPALVRRFSETRRPHPLAPDRSALEGIREERTAMRAIRHIADHVVDTSEMTVHELRHAFTGVAAGSPPGAELVVTILSFGFKHGIPVDSDLLFDVRFLPNPHFVPRLRPHTGRNADVVRYLERSDATREFLEHTLNLLRFLVPQYVHEGKTYLTIGIGCTGGRHRSVAIAEALKKGLTGIPGARLRVKHRDIANE